MSRSPRPSGWSTRRPGPTGSWCVPRAGCRGTSTSCGARHVRVAITSSTATRPWATRSRGVSASRWPSPTGGCS
jgi:hypothetical protein